MIPSPIYVARAFDRILRTHIAPHEYAEAVRMNAEDPAYSADSGCCASHDFCDANMTMLEAFASVTGKGEDEIVRLTFGEGADIDWDGEWVTAWNAAWDAWRTMPKDPPELPEGAEMTTAGAFRSRCVSEGMTIEEADPEWHGIRAGHPDDFPYIVWQDGSVTPWYGNGGIR